MKFTYIIASLFFSSFAFATAGTIQVPLNEYMQLMQQGQGGPANCMANLGQTLNESLSSSYDAYSQQTQTLIENSSKAVDQVQACRNNLLGLWQKFQEKEAENKQKRNELSLKIRQAQNDYQREILKIKRECQSVAREEQQKYAAQITQGGVINDPTRAVGFQKGIVQFYDRAFNNCYRGDAIQRESLLLAADQLKINIDAAKEEVAASNEALKYMQQQTKVFQEEEIQKCEENKNLVNYSQSLTEQVAKRGRSLATQQNVLGMVQGIVSCGMPGQQPGLLNSDTTSSPFQNGEKL